MGRLYAALDGADREELAALPVPLADGRTAHGPAGVLLPEPGLPVARLGPLGLRLAEPGGGRRPRPGGCSSGWGAAGDGGGRPRRPRGRGPPSRRRWTRWRTPWTTAPTPRTSPRRCSRWSRPRARRSGELPWLAELALPDADGGWAPAGELVLPGSPLAAVLTSGALGMLDREFAATADPDALRAVGVLDTFAVVRADDPDDLDVDDADRWADAVLDRLPHDAPPPEWPALTAVRDLELVADWPGALPLLAAAARPRPGPTSSLGGVPAPGYLRWWLSTHPVLGGERPDRLRHPDSTELQGLYEPATAVRRCSRCCARRPRSTTCSPTSTARSTCSTGSATPPHGAPRRAPDGLRPAGHGARRASTWTRRSGCGSPPDRVVEDAVVLDAPYLQPLVDAPVVPAGGRPGPVADLLDLPLASELVRAR